MVSVIVPVYNAEKTLRACVESILGQTYRGFELILIDDGSKDKSGELCDELQKNCAERGVSCRVIHKENGGVSSARNCGMENAEGEYFVCIDSDDIVEPCYLEDLVMTAAAHPEFGHVICGFRGTSDDHEYILTDTEPLTVVTRKDYMRLFNSVLIQGPCMALYKTGIVQSNSITMPEDLSLAEDLIFNLRYLDHLGEAKIGVINKTNYVYQNEDSNSLNNKYRTDLLDINEFVIESIKQYLEKWDVTDEDSWRRYYTAVFYKYISVLDNTFSSFNNATSAQKYRLNNSVMRKSSFREALDKSGIELPLSYLIAYRSGCYRMVLAAKMIEKLKIACLKHLKGLR